VTEIRIETRRGSAAELHALDPFRVGGVSAPTVWVCDVTTPAIVLGSRQTPAVLDVEECARRGLEVVKRRSGGGAVLLRPAAITWIDLILPHGTAPDDVRGSMIWVGQLWRDALAALGADSNRLAVHVGGLVCTSWSNLVCFAGLGPGELLVDERKLLGLSQRRTRDGIRVQCQIHREPLVSTMRDLFVAPHPDEAPEEPAALRDVLRVSVTDDELGVAVADAVVTAISGSE
jgi:lipoate-protein ligase A